MGARKFGKRAKKKANSTVDNLGITPTPRVIPDRPMPRWEWREWLRAIILARRIKDR